MSENKDQRWDDKPAPEPLPWADIDNVEALRALVADDGYAASFQSTGRYRAALLRHLEPLAQASLVAAATVRTWRQRIGVNKEWPLHAPNDVERAMVAEIAELRTAFAAKAEALAPTEGIMVPKFAGQFDSHQDWVNRASRVLTVRGDPAVCVDAKGRRCHIGADMRRVAEENAFPVRYFWECEMVAAPSAPEASPGAQP